MASGPSSRADREKRRPEAKPTKANKPFYKQADTQAGDEAQMRHISARHPKHKRGY